MGENEWKGLMFKRSKWWVLGSVLKGGLKRGTKFEKVKKLPNSFEVSNWNKKNVYTYYFFPYGEVWELHHAVKVRCIVSLCTFHDVCAKIDELDLHKIWNTCRFYTTSSPCYLKPVIHETWIVAVHRT